MGAEQKISVFTKPWHDPLPRLAETMTALGVDGVELPVRPGYQVEPEGIGASLPKAVSTFEQYGLEILSVAGSLDEETVMACGDCGVPVLRTMCRIDLERGFRASIEDYWRTFDALLPALERANVTIGVQNHSGYFIGSAAGMLYLLKDYNPRHVAVVLDMAHCAVAGEPVELAVDAVFERMCPLANFKSAFQRRMNGPEDHEPEHVIAWSTHHHGVYSWRAFYTELQKRGFSGTLCLPAEYSARDLSDRRTGDVLMPYLRDDLAYLRSLMRGE